jgi:hypothetical protein
MGVVEEEAANKIEISARMDNLAFKIQQDEKKH